MITSDLFHILWHFLKECLTISSLNFSSKEQFCPLKVATYLPIVPTLHFDQHKKNWAENFAHFKHNNSSNLLERKIIWSPRNLCRPIVSLSSGDTPVSAVQFLEMSSVVHQLYQFGLSPLWKSQIPNLTSNIVSTLHCDMTSKWNYRILHAALQYTTGRLNYQWFLNEDWRSSTCVLQPSINLPQR